MTHRTSYKLFESIEGLCLWVAQKNGVGMDSMLASWYRKLLRNNILNRRYW